LRSFNLCICEGSLVWLFWAWLTVCADEAWMVGGKGGRTEKLVFVELWDGLLRIVW
jgi:hypothetical protein